MAESHLIVANLRRIAVLLAANGEKEHAEGFERLADQFMDDIDWNKARVRRLFGGMGSFNDLVLHDQLHIPLQSENDELNRLRSELWRLSQNYSKTAPEGPTPKE